MTPPRRPLQRANPKPRRILPFRLLPDVARHEVHRHIAETALAFPARERTHAILSDHFIQYRDAARQAHQTTPHDDYLKNLAQASAEVALEFNRLRPQFRTPAKTRAFLRKTIARSVRELVRLDQDLWGAKNGLDSNFMLGEILLGATPAELEKRVEIVRTGFEQWKSFLRNARSVNARLPVRDRAYLEKKISEIKKTLLILYRRPPLSPERKRWYVEYALSREGPPVPPSRPPRKGA